MKKLLFPIVMIILVFFKVYNDKKETHHTKKDVHWTYKGETSPEHWAEIEKNSDCGGKRQSPVNIIDIYTTTLKQDKNPLTINYSASTQINKVVNNGHSIQFNFEAGDSIKYKIIFII